MNSHSSELDKKEANYEEMFDCDICCRPYNQDEIQPDVLPCGHTFCSSCWKDFRNVCPKCREKFEASQVKKNYFVIDLLDRKKSLPTQAKENNGDKCSVHKRELDRFCKSCRKVMCSVCHCEHLGSTLMISDVNLRDEIEGIEKSLMTFQAQKQVMEIKIAAGFQAKVEEIEKEEAGSKRLAEVSLKEEVQKIQNRRENLVQEAIEDARQKIKLVEEEKQMRIQEVETIAKEYIEERETSHERVINDISSRKMNLLYKIEFRKQLLLKKLEIFRDLEELQTDTLNQCAVLYQTWEDNKFQSQEISQLEQSPVELLFDEHFDVQQQNKELKNQGGHEGHSDHGDRGNYRGRGGRGRGRGGFIGQQSYDRNQEESDQKDSDQDKHNESDEWRDQGDRGSRGIHGGRGHHRGRGDRGGRGGRGGRRGRGGRGGSGGSGSMFDASKQT